MAASSRLSFGVKMTRASFRPLQAQNGAPDAIKNFVSRNTPRWIGQVLLMTGDHFVAEPLLDRRVTLAHPPPSAP